MRSTNSNPSLAPRGRQLETGYSITRDSAETRRGEAKMEEQNLELCAVCASTKHMHECIVHIIATGHPWHHGTVVLWSESHCLYDSSRRSWPFECLPLLTARTGGG